jgi:hypothetical protein
MPFALVVLDYTSADSDKSLREFRSQMSFDEFTLDSGVYTLNDAAWLFDLNVAMDKCAQLIAAARKLKVHVLHLSDVETRMAMVSTPRSVRMDQFLRPRRLDT